MNRPDSKDRIIAGLVYTCEFADNIDRMAAINSFRIQLADDSRLGVYCGLSKAVWPEHDEGLEEVLRDRKVLPPEQQVTYWIGDVNEEPVGYATAYRYVGEYHPLKWNINIGTIKEFRGQGLGSALYKTALEFVETQNAISIATRVSDLDHASIAFAQNRGYIEQKRDFESELILEEFDPTISVPNLPPIITIHPASEIDDPDHRKEFHELFETVRVDVPRHEPPVRLSFDQFQELVLDDPAFLWEVTRIAMADGKMVGFSGMFKRSQPGQLDQWLTGVKREFRGQKIAQALKQAAAKAAIDAGYKRIRTNNDTRNASMLAINDAMGFRRLPGTITLVKQYGASP